MNAAQDRHGVILKEIELGEIWWLRADAANEAFREAAQNAFGHPLPLHPNACVRRNGIELFYPQPDAWLCIDTTPSTSRIRKALDHTNAIDCGSYSIEMTAAYRRLAISGTSSRTLLAEVCALDLSDGAFSESTCAITRVAEVAAILTRSGNHFHVDCPRTYIEALMEVLAPRM